MEKAGRKRVLLLFLAVAMLTAGCGGGSGSTSDSASSYSSDDSGASNYAEDYEADYEAGDMEVSGAENGGGEDAAADSAGDRKLVYTSSVRIDTLEFEKSCDTLDEMIDRCGGFIESKSVEDDGAYSYYVYDDEQETLRHTLTATIRVPSENYDSFMSGISELGDVRTETENVENMTPQYGTLQSQLEIYEQEYDRYMEMLGDVSDDSVVLQIKEDITQISVEIATIKSQMAAIDTDVEYSTVDIVIQEVSKYQEERDKSTFVGRLKGTLSDSWDGLLGLLEGLLFFLILNWYKLLILVILVFAVVKFVKWRKKKRLKKERERGYAYGQVPNNGYPMPPNMPTGGNVPPVNRTVQGAAEKPTAEPGAQTGQAPPESSSDGANENNK